MTRSRPKTKLPLVLLVGLDWMVAELAAGAIRKRFRCRTITFTTEHTFRVWWERNSSHREIKCVVMGLQFPWAAPAKKRVPTPPGYHESGGGKSAGKRVAELIPDTVRFTFFDVLSKNDFLAFCPDYPKRKYIVADTDHRSLLAFISGEG